MKWCIVLAWCAFLQLASALPTRADDAGINAHYGRIYETAKAGLNTQGFVEIDNAADVTETLTGIDCPVAESSRIVGPDGAPIRQLQVASGKQLSLTPQGPHILLQSTHFSIDEGGAIPCTLTFQNAGAILVYLYATPAP
jgi:copper(I)-binding protein